MIKGVMLFIIGCGIVGGARADGDCVGYKIKPAIYMDAPVENIQISQPDLEIDFLHGNVTATMTDNYDIIADVVPEKDGYCVVLKRVNSTVGFSDFFIQIDSRHTPDSCTYNAILSHEKTHVDAYRNIMNEMTGEFKDAIYNAADTIMPIWVNNVDSVNAAIDDFNTQLQRHPELILIKQKINAAQEIRNKKIDVDERGGALRECLK